MRKIYMIVYMHIKHIDIYSHMYIQWVGVVFLYIYTFFIF